MAQVAHRIVHFPRAGRTVQTDNIDVVDIQNCGCGIDIRTQQHGSIFCILQSHLHLQRHTFAGSFHGVEGSGDRYLGLENVLRCFNQQNIHTGSNERCHLLDVRCEHFVEPNMSKRWQLGRRSY